MLVRLPPRRALLALAILVGTLGLPACRKGAPAGSGGDMGTIILVTNRGYYDVNVYAIRAVGVTGRRLATVTGGSNATLRVREIDQQPGGGVMLSLRAIGARATWTTPVLNVGFGSVARLDIRSASGGDLSQSQFYLATPQYVARTPATEGRAATGAPTAP